MILSIDAEKAFDKIQHPFMTKALKKLGIVGMFLNVVKAIYDKPTANIVLDGEQLKLFSLVKNETGLTAFSTAIQYSLGIGKTVRQEQEIKGIRIGKEEVKISLFANDMTYLRDPKNSTKKQLEIINSFSKVRYKINIQKSVVFLQINNEQNKKEIRETIPFTIAQKQ
jgi:hypothetical protein